MKQEQRVNVVVNVGEDKIKRKKRKKKKRTGAVIGIARQQPIVLHLPPQAQPFVPSYQPVQGFTPDRFTPHSVPQEVAPITSTLPQNNVAPIVTEREVEIVEGEQGAIVMGNRTPAPTPRVNTSPRPNMGFGNAPAVRPVRPPTIEGDSIDLDLYSDTDASSISTTFSGEENPDDPKLKQFVDRFSDAISSKKDRDLYLKAKQKMELTNQLREQGEMGAEDIDATDVRGKKVMFDEQSIPPSTIGSIGKSSKISTTGSLETYDEASVAESEPPSTIGKRRVGRPKGRGDTKPRVRRTKEQLKASPFGQRMKEAFGTGEIDPLL